jgi:hypothetical protein
VTSAEIPDAFSTVDATIVRRLVLVASALAGVLEVASAGRAAWSLAIVQGLVTLVVAFTVRRWVVTAA